MPDKSLDPGVGSSLTFSLSDMPVAARLGLDCQCDSPPCPEEDLDPGVARYLGGIKDPGVVNDPGEMKDPRGEKGPGDTIVLDGVSPNVDIGVSVAAGVGAVVTVATMGVPGFVLIIDGVGRV